MRLLIVDDHPVYRDGLAALLSQVFGGAIVEQAESAASAFARLVRGEPVDLLLLDLGIAGMGGEAALPLLRARHPALPVVVVSADEDPHTVRRCLDAGASGYIPKSARREVLAEALQTVIEGGIYRPPGSHRPADPRLPPTLRLTPRERAVLDCLCNGLPNKAIAARLDMAEATVRVHLGSIFRVLGVTSRTQAVITARGLPRGGDEPESP